MIEPVTIDILVPEGFQIIAKQLEIPVDGLVYASIVRRIMTGKTPTGSLGVWHAHKAVLNRHTLDTIKSHGGQDVVKWISDAFNSVHEDGAWMDSRKWYETALPGGGSGKISKTK